MDEVKIDVKRLRKHLRIWKRQEKRPPFHSATKRILFAFYNVPEIKEIRENFVEYHNNLSLMLQLLIIKGQKESLKPTREPHEMNSRSNEILNENKASLAESRK
jgi:hypothetical protein